MNPRDRHQKTSALLPFLANGTLVGPERAEVEAHVENCLECSAAYREWEQLAAAVLADQSAVALPRLVVPTRRRSSTGTRTSGQLHHLLEVFVAQLTVVRRPIWAASALVMAIGTAVAWISPSRATSTLALVAPLVAAAGVGFLYGAENDPPLEIALATPTSPRLILLARLTLVFGYDLALGLLASLVIGAAELAPDRILGLVQNWLGPMLLLSAMSLLLSLRLGSLMGASLVLGAWGVFMSVSPQAAQVAPAAVNLLASTNAITALVALGMFAFVLHRLPLQERLA